MKHTTKDNMIQIITKASALSKRNYITYKFNDMEAARGFVNEHNLEGKIIDIIS